MNVIDRIDALDWSLLEEIECQATADDRRSLLALHSACRAVHGSFDYLEIGSHLGGSLQALVRDPACRTIVSIDSRPAEQPDQRGESYAYADNSTQRMLDGLAALDGADTAKVTTIDASTEDLAPAAVPVVPALAFIDGEHTDDAAVRDARFCRDLMGGRGAIAFHDAWIVHRGIQRFIDETYDAGIFQRPYLLPDTVLVVEMGEAPLIETPQVTAMLRDNYRGFLWSLRQESRYREALGRGLPRVLRRLGLLRLER